MQLSNISLPVQHMRTERGKGGWDDEWKKETQLKVDGGVTFLAKFFSFQAFGDSLTEGEADVVSPSVQGCLNTVYASNRRFWPLMLLLIGI